MTRLDVSDKKPSQTPPTASNQVLDGNESINLRILLDILLKTSLEANGNENSSTFNNETLGDFFSIGTTNMIKQIQLLNGNPTKIDGSLFVYLKFFNNIFDQFDNNALINGLKFSLGSPKDVYRSLLVPIVKKLVKRAFQILEVSGSVEKTVKISILKLLSHSVRAYSKLGIQDSDLAFDQKKFFSAIFNILLDSRAESQPGIVSTKAQILFIALNNLSETKMAEMGIEQNLRNQARKLIESLLKDLSQVFKDKFSPSHFSLFFNVLSLLINLSPLRPYKDHHRCLPALNSLNQTQLSAFLLQCLKYSIFSVIKRENRQIFNLQIFLFSNFLNFSVQYPRFQSLHARGKLSEDSKQQNQSFIFEILSRDWLVALLSNQSHRAITRKIDLVFGLLQGNKIFRDWVGNWLVDDIGKEVSQVGEGTSLIVKKAKETMEDDSEVFCFKILTSGFEKIEVRYGTLVEFRAYTSYLLDGLGKLYEAEIKSMKKFKILNKKLGPLSEQILVFLNNDSTHFLLKLDLAGFFLKNMFLCPKFLDLKIEKILNEVELVLDSQVLRIDTADSKTAIRLRKAIQFNHLVLTMALNFLESCCLYYPLYINRKVVRKIRRARMNYQLDKRDKIEVFYLAIKKSAENILKKFYDVINPANKASKKVLNWGMLTQKLYNREIFKILTNISERILYEKLDRKSLKKHLRDLTDYSRLQEVFKDMILPLVPKRKIKKNFEKSLIFIQEIVQKRHFSLQTPSKNIQIPELIFSKFFNENPITELKKLYLFEAENHFETTCSISNQFYFQVIEEELFGVNDLIKCQYYLVFNRVHQIGCLSLNFVNTSNIFLEKVTVKVELQNLKATNTEAVVEIDDFAGFSSRTVTLNFQNLARGPKIVSVRYLVEEERFLVSTNEKLGVEEGEEQQGFDFVDDEDGHLRLWYRSSIDVRPLDLLLPVQFGGMRRISGRFMSCSKRFLAFSDFGISEHYGHLCERFGFAPYLNYVGDGRGGWCADRELNLEVLRRAEEGGEKSAKKGSRSEFSAVGYFEDVMGALLCLEVIWAPNAAQKFDIFFVKPKLKFFSKFLDLCSKT